MLLGGFGVLVGDRRVPDAWRLRKAKSLVKLLALNEDHRAHREVVIAMLWPDLAPDRAMNNLHQALHAARRALRAAGASDEVLRLKDDLVGLCPDDGLRTDVDEFVALSQRALASGRAHECRAALRGYAGELLPEDRFEDWVVPQRERLAALHAAVQQRLAAALLSDGEVDEAVRLLQTLAEQRPTDEPCHRMLMRALDAGGRRWDALDVYDRLRQTLEDEFAAGSGTRHGAAAPPAARGSVRRDPTGQHQPVGRTCQRSSVDVASWPTCPGFWTGPGCSPSAGPEVWARPGWPSSWRGG